MTDTIPADQQVHDDLRILTIEYLSAVRSRLARIESPVARERAARLFTDQLLPAVAKTVKDIRTAAVGELRQGRTLREVSELIGLSVPRVDQLLKGK
ncbi:hypothetical protein DEJ51_28900 [Streptomyces venezuelae]|uniref:RNA polymerase sigma-70 region 4 domain-containing protein n=1 Tax=Streptomyces venezuelae TaxID=54571 RepID=A0A5P2DU96_STRVZ|nr:hypothetical protein [Streptomyces venezuelae]QES57698.1 hypothetical protein DEJ51_28900 [Streptomyces venezuelae]